VNFLDREVAIRAINHNYGRHFIDGRHASCTWARRGPRPSPACPTQHISYGITVLFLTLYLFDKLLFAPKIKYRLLTFSVWFLSFIDQERLIHPYFWSIATRAVPEILGALCKL
jgi:hypothetical protein